MDDRDWLILKALYEKMNITKAAESLYITQPSLTKRLQQMEKEFKVTIVERGSKGVHFTPQGEFLAKCADEMLDRLREIKEQTLNIEEEVVGTLRLGVSNYISRYKMPRLLGLFRKKFPKVEFKVINGFSRTVFNHIYNQNVHVGIVRGEYDWPECKSLLFEENICVTSSSKLELEQLPQLPRIEYESDALLKDIIDHWWSRNFSEPPNVVMEVDKGDTCTEMVINGLGYGILPSVFADKHPHLHRINLTDKDGKPIVRKTWMFYHQKSLETKIVKAFVDFVEGLDFKHDI